MAGEETNRRGGEQSIPRPEHVRDGDPAPWITLTPRQRSFALDTLAQRFAALGPAEPTPREPTLERASAVLAGLYEHDGELWVVLTRRSRNLRAHSGEVSFPGGRQDPGEDLFMTAL